MRSFDLISGSFWFLVGLGFVAGGFGYGFGSWREPGPGFLPVIFGAVLAVLSFVLLAVSLFRSKPQTNAAFWEMKGSWKSVLAVSISLLCYMLLFKQFGFILITFLFLFFLLRFIGRKGWLTSISVALILSIFCHGLFSILLGTPLPKGRIYGSAFRTSARV